MFEFRGIISGLRSKSLVKMSDKLVTRERKWRMLDDSVSCKYNIKDSTRSAGSYDLVSQNLENTYLDLHIISHLAGKKLHSL